jgi:putative membrane protein
MDSKDFITKAIQGNLAEISVGQLAQQKGGSDAVKKFGEMLVSDHTKANTDATNVAKSLGVTVPTAPSDDEKKTHDKLAGENGATFDSDFASAMVSDHKKDVAEYQDIADHNKDAAGDYASKTLPALKKHLETAQSLEKDMGASATPSDGTSGALAAGANSFTEGQAKSRIEKAGFSNVSDLKKDDQGIWRGTATKDGKSTPVGLDFKGNVAAQ